MEWFTEEHFARLLRRQDTIVEELKELRKLMQITQAQLDAIAASLTTIDTTVESIATEVGALQANNPSLDLTGLNAAASKLSTDVNTLQTSLQPVTAPVTS